MKSLFLAFFALLLAPVLEASANAAPVAAPSAPRVSVTRFNQEVDHIFEGCRGWVFNQQDQLRTVLEAELSRQGLRVLERRSIRDIHADEFNLPNLDQRTVARRNRFVAAQYAVTGAITELGVCEAASGGGIQLGGLVSLLGGPAGADLRVGGGKVTSRVKLAAQLVSVETGEILRSFEAQAEVSDTARSVSVGVAGIGADHHGRSAPPIEAATNRALRDLAEQMAGYLGRGVRE